MAPTTMTAPMASSLAETMTHRARRPIRAPTATTPVSSTRITTTRTVATTSGYGTRTPKLLMAPTVICDQARATTAAASWSSRMSAQPMIHAHTSPKMT